MKIPRPTDDDMAALRRAVAELPGVTVKPMFGNLGAFVNGNMFAGLFGSAVGVRLVDEAGRAELSAVEGSGPFGPSERPMKGYITLPVHWGSDTDDARTWIGRAFTEVSGLPPKRPKR